MKAIILERRGEYAAALREDGVVVRTRRSGEVGDAIELRAEIVRFPGHRQKRMRSAVAAALAVVILGGSYTYTTASACSYVSLDVEETSVELSVNRLGRVIGVRGLNGDSAAAACPPPSGGQAQPGAGGAPVPR